MDPSRPRAVTSSPGGLCALQVCGKVLQNEPTVSGVGQTHDGGKRLKFWHLIASLCLRLPTLHPGSLLSSIYPRIHQGASSGSDALRGISIIWEETHLLFYERLQAQPEDLIVCSIESIG